MISQSPNLCSYAPPDFCYGFFLHFTSGCVRYVPCFFALVYMYFCIDYPFAPVCVFINFLLMQRRGPSIGFTVYSKKKYYQCHNFHLLSLDNLLAFFCFVLLHCLDAFNAYKETQSSMITLPFSEEAIDVNCHHQMVSSFS